MNHLAYRMAQTAARLDAGRMDWYRIENSRTSDTVEVYLYDYIGTAGVTAKDFVADLKKIKASNIEMHIDSPGGNVWEGVSIYNAVRDHPAHVTVIVDAMAASAASFIAQAGDKRIMNRHAEMMIHDAHGQVVGNSRDMAEAIEFMDRMSDKIAGIYADHAGGTADQWRDLMRKESWYTGEEAVAANLADEVIIATYPANSANRTMFDLSAMYTYAGRENAPAPTPVIETPEEAPEEDPFAGIDWTTIADALKGAFA